MTALRVKCRGRYVVCLFLMLRWLNCSVDGPRLVSPVEAGLTENGAEVSDTVGGSDQDSEDSTDEVIPGAETVLASDGIVVEESEDDLSDGDGCPGDTCLPEKCPRGFQMISAGQFLMGSKVSENGRDTDEVQHWVAITRDFCVKALETTQGEWKSLMGNNPSRFTECGDSCPVENVDWYDALEFCNRLSLRDGLEPCYLLEECAGIPGKGSGFEGEFVCTSVVFEGLDCTGYRLPTEAEWEFAARGGMSGATSNGTSDDSHQNCQEPNAVLDPIAWFCGNSAASYDGSHDCSAWSPNRSCGTQPGGRLRSNPFGVFDALGNVWEWCWDWGGAYVEADQVDPTGPAAGTGRIRRGGSWEDDASQIRAANRKELKPQMRFDGLGFRPVKVL